MSGDRRQSYRPSYAVLDRRVGAPVSVHLTFEQYQALDAIARQRNVTRTSLIREMVREYLDRHQWLAPEEAGTT